MHTEVIWSEWTDSEIDFLKNNYQNMTCYLIAKKLDRTTKSVQHKFNQLQLKRYQANVGEIINDWEIKEIFTESLGSQNVKMAKIKSILEDGIERVVRLTLLTNRQIAYPGRKRPDLTKKNTTHGSSRTRLYRIWSGIKNRCLNSKQLSYLSYGAKGIKICDEWKNDFYVFKLWSEANGYQDNLTIDRINNLGDYCPKNCRWVSWDKQVVNKSNSSKMIITAFNETKSIYEWVRDNRCKTTLRSLKHRVLSQRLSPEEMITLPPERSKKEDLKGWLKENHPEIYGEFNG